VEVDVQVSPVQRGDVFLLASDGLDVLGRDEIRACLQLPPADAVDRLIARSLAEGAPDNVTVIVARVEDAKRAFDRRLP
jgi:protein phosphatase